MLNKKWLTVAAAAAACISSVALAAGPLRIGAALPLTGDLQAFGAASLNGVKLAAQEINSAGGVLGAKVEISSGDTQTLPQPGVAAAQKLINANRVVAIVGAMSSGVTIPIAQSVSKVDHVPQISPASTSPVITHLNDGDFLFRTVPSDAYQGVALAQVVHDAGVKKVSIIYVNNDYGEGLAQAFTKAFQKEGGSVLAKAAYEQKQASYTAELNKAWADGSTPDLVLIGYPQNGVTILRESLENAMFTKFFFTDGMKSPVIIKNLGAKYLNGSLGTVAQARKGTPAAKHFANAYKKAYGELPPQPYIDTAYDATYILALAAEKAGDTTDGTKIRDAIRDVANPPGTKIYPGQWAKAVKLIKAGKDIDWVGAAGEENFDKNGDVTGTYAEWTIKNGKIETVKLFNPAM